MITDLPDDVLHRIGDYLSGGEDFIEINRCTVVSKRFMTVYTSHDWFISGRWIQQILNMFKWDHTALLGEIIRECIENEI